MSSTINRRTAIGERTASDTPVNHAAKRAETEILLWHCRTRCGTPGDQRVPDGTVEFIHARTQLWRREIVQARIRLADEGLTYAQRAELWRIVDYREWCLQILVRDFPAELERIDREIEHELRR
jgi:hypothetical protein